MNDFIGKKFNLKKSSHVIKTQFLGTIDIESYELDDPIMEQQLRNAYEEVRIIPPDTMVTADYVDTRTNVYISSDGIIEEITKG